MNSLFKKKRLVTGVNGGVYNPSAIVYQKDTVCILRVEDIPEHKRKDWLETTAKARLLIISEEGVERFQDLEFRNLPVGQKYRVEDFRLFEHNNELYCSHPYVVEINNGLEVKQVISIINLKENTFTLVHVFDSPFKKPIEKNWGFFVDNNSLYLLYSVSPWVIYKVNKDWSLELIIRDNYNGEWEVSKIDGMISISSLPVKYNNSYLVVIHSRVNKQYIQGAILFDSETFKPIFGTKEAFLRGGKEKGIRPNVLYIMSTVVQENTIDFYYGEGDTHSSIYTIDKQEFNKIIYKNKID